MRNSSNLWWPVRVSSWLLRLRSSLTASWAALVLFLVASSLWLVAAGTARPAVIAAPCIREPCPGLASFTVLSSRSCLLLGISGAVLVVGSLVLMVRPAMSQRRPAGFARLALTTAAGLAGVLAEVLIILVVTRVAIATAPYGIDSGEGAAAIAVLAAAQIPLVVALAAIWSRLLRSTSGQRSPGQYPPWVAIAGLGGMALNCGAFAAWGLQAGTNVGVNTTLIAGHRSLVNAGAWWPGLFAVLLTLLLMAAAVARGRAFRADRAFSDQPHPSTPASALQSRPGC